MNLKNEKALIVSLTFLAFILGTTEYVIVGLLGEVSGALGISLAKAGHFVSGFAIAYAVGTPFAMMASSYFPKRTSLLIGVCLVIILNLCSALSSSYESLLVTRTATAVMCGVSVSLAISISSDCMPVNRRGQVISYILGGFSVANVLGVPIGTFVGQHFRWPAAFLLISLFGLIALFMLWHYVPRDLPNMKSRIMDQAGLLINPRILLVFLIPVLGIAAIFVIYTYIGPIMTEVMQIPEEWTGWLLLLYGAATIVSNVIGGKVASGNYVVNLRNIFALHAVIFLAFAVNAPLPVLGLISLISIACISYSINAASQLYLIDLTERFVPKAKDLSASLMPVGANIGIAIGAGVGGIIVDHAGFIYLPWMAMAFAVSAMVITMISYKLDRAQEVTKRMSHISH